MRELEERKAKASTERTALAVQLLAVGVTQVHIDYDGEGDEGSIGDIEYFKGDERAEIVAISEPLSEAPETLRDRIVDIAYAVLEMIHGGWEINEGSFGNLRWNTRTNIITIEHSERVIQTEESVDEV